MERDAEVIEVLNELVARKPRWGFWKLHDRLRLDGRCINHKRLHRVYCELGLRAEAIPDVVCQTRPRRPLVAATELNQTWAVDFMSDVLHGRRWFLTFNVIEEANREALGIEVATSIPCARVIRVMEQLIEMYGKLQEHAGREQGSELTSIAFGGVRRERNRRSSCRSSRLEA